MENVSSFEHLVPRRPELDFTLVRNGMDYLSSAVLYLTGSIRVPAEAADLWPRAEEGPSQARPWLSDRHLKYGVLHLQSATEVLLKARLVREHWSLVFANPGSATLAEYEKGTFTSCDMNAALDRLVRIVGLPISDKERGYLADLAKTRNALTHYGHTANAFAVEARAARVLSFLVDFVPKQLQPKLSRDVDEVIRTMTAVRKRLNDISALVSGRMQDLTSELKPVAERTVICATCRQMALVVGEESPHCRFCLRSYESVHEAVEAYWEDICLGEFAEAPQDCPECKTRFVVALVSTRADPLTEVALCFNCAAVYRKEG
ncbi:hypothetical protein ACFXMT_19975 [Streptomyces mirabilis]|uniref:hypothetical protein n=1 Tax=Streptomyces mirabilis TaxID=68239 RepID=UPI0036BBEC84